MMELQKYNNMKVYDLRNFITIVFMIIDDIYKQIIPKEIKTGK